MDVVLVRVSIAVERHHDHRNSYKGRHLIGGDLQFRGSVHYHHVGKHDSVQADVVLEKELRVLHWDPQAAEGDCVPTLGMAFSNKASPTPTRSHLLIVPLPMDQAFKHMRLWGHIYSNHHRPVVRKSLVAGNIW